jgi:hypothetical protein
LCSHTGLVPFFSGKRYTDTQNGLAILFLTLFPAEKVFKMVNIFTYRPVWNG